MSTASPTIEELFLAAVERDALADRVAFLEDACDGEAGVRQRVEALLRAHDRAGSFLETPLVGLDTDEPGERETVWPEPPAERSGYVDWEPVARGGMGVVFRARDPKLERPVAVKMLAPEFALREEAHLRFLREARAAAAVRNEHVVTIHAIVDEAEPPYLVMEWIEGRTLQDRLAGGESLPWREAAGIARRIATGLAAAHDRGLVHRDVKPGNVLLESETGRVLITDFGLARPVDDLDLTREGTIAGTPRYMSPEQAEGKPVDHRTDLFSLGAVLYTMLAGRTPFEGDSTPALLHAIRYAEPQPLAGFSPDVPPSLADLVANLLAKSATDRPATARAVAERLAAILNEDGPVVESRPRANGRWWPWAAGAAVAVGAAAVIGPRPWDDNVPDQRVATTTDGDREAPSTDPAGDSGAGTDTDSTKAAVDTVSPGDGDPERVEPVDLDPGTEVVAPPAEPPELPSPDTLVEIRKMTAEGRLGDLAVSSERVFVAGEKGMVHGWDLRTGDSLFELKHEANVGTIALSNDGTLLATADLTRHVRLWDASTGKSLGAIPLAVPVRDLVFSPDGSEVVVSLASRPARGEEPRGRAVPFDRKLSVFDTKTRRPVRTLPLDDGRRFSDLAWSPDGRWIAASTLSGTVLLMDAARGRIELELSAAGVAGPAYAVGFSHDSKRLRAAGAGNLLWCWTVPDGVKESFHVFSQSIVRFDVDPRERWVIAGGALEVRFADLDAPDGPITIQPLAGHESPIRDVQFVPGRPELVSSGWDGTVRLWGPREVDSTDTSPE